MNNTPNNKNRHFTKLESVSIASVIDRIIMNPVDNIIAMQQSKDLSTSQAIRFIIKKEHWVGFYRGMLLPSLFSAPSRLAMYWTYLTSVAYSKAHFGNQLYKTYLTAGVLSGICEALVICPLEMYRITNLLHTLSNRELFSSVRQLYRGLPPLFVRTIFGNTLTLAGADILCDHMGNHTPSYYFASGLISSTIAQTISTPADVLKTKMMCDPKRTNSTLAHMSIIWHQRSMYKGFLPRVTRFSFGNAIMLSTVKYLHDDSHSSDPLDDLETEALAYNL